VFLDVLIACDFFHAPLAFLSHVFQDVPLSHAFFDVPSACDFCHVPSYSWLLCDVHVPLTNSPMAPSHDVPFACTYW
jgi:hypothetical protein